MGSGRAAGAMRSSPIGVAIRHCTVPSTSAHEVSGLYAIAIRRLAHPTPRCLRYGSMASVRTHRHVPQTIAARRIVSERADSSPGIVCAESTDASPVDCTEGSAAVAYEVSPLGSTNVSATAGSLGAGARVVENRGELTGV